MTNLGRRMKEMREKSEMSQEIMAKRLGVSRPTLSLIENGARKLTAEESKKAADIFGVSIDSLFEEKKEPQFIIKETRAEYRKAEPEIRLDIPQKNFKKFKEVLLYILNKVGAKPNIGETVIYKLLYFIDFDHYERYEEQLIGATYQKNKYGPTPMEFQRIIEKMIAGKDIARLPNKYFCYPQTKYLPLRGPDLSYLDAREKETIDRVLDRLSEMNARQISDYSHQDVPWLTTDEDKIISYEAVFYRTPPYTQRNYDEPI